MRECHEENANLLSRYVQKYGWLLPSKYGRKVHEAAWFIAIHAISKPEIVRQALNILNDALRKGEKVAGEYARLFDRIELYEGRQQIYGTQFFPSTKGFYARNLKDPINVDKRRSSIGLSTFLEGKKESGADKGGFITPEEEKNQEKQFIKFLKEVGWRA